MRSGFVAGDADLLKKFLLYRTYHGSAMSPSIQAASIAAWNDEQHVVENRAKYIEKFKQVTPMLAEVLDVQLPDAGFYLWAGVDKHGALSDTELKDLIQQLTEEEQEVSYKRRILHGKIDILRAELVNRLRKKHEEGESVISGADVQQLTDILAGKGIPADADIE